MKSQDIFVKYMRNKRDEERLQKVDKGKPTSQMCFLFTYFSSPHFFLFLSRKFFFLFLFFLQPSSLSIWEKVGQYFCPSLPFPLAVKKTRSGGKGGTYGFLYFFSSLIFLFLGGKAITGVPPSFTRYFTSERVQEIIAVVK